MTQRKSSNKHPEHMTAEHKRNIRGAALRMRAATEAIATHEHAHEEHRTLVEHVLYPPHAARTQTAAYTAIHRYLVHERKLPCIVCGVTADTLHDPAHNPFGATALETHHHMVEWALSNAIDVEKFNSRVVRMLHARNPNDPRYADPRDARYARRFTREEMVAWIDHDPDNLWVLCDVHHRHRDVGIHMISGPIWGAQDLLLPEYLPGHSGAQGHAAPAHAAHASRSRGHKAHADEAPAAPHSEDAEDIHPSEVEQVQNLFVGLLKGLFSPR